MGLKQRVWNSREISFAPGLRVRFLETLAELLTVGRVSRTLVLPFLGIFLPESELQLGLSSGVLR